jgi:hypothetical protein
MDPVTGERATTIAPEAVAAIDTAAEAAPGIAALLALFFPALYPAVGLVAGAAGAWARMKPRVVAATNEAEIYHAATESIVQTLEQWKTANPEAWETLRTSLGDNIGENTEAVIRAMRGLPPKD